MLKISICPAVAEDAAAIAALNQTCLGQTAPVSLVEKQLRTMILRREEKLLVAVYRGKMIAYIHARDDLRTYRAPQKVILAVAVDREYRHQGVATALFEAIVEWAQKDGCEAVTAAVGGSHAAQGFFAACGCEERLNRKQYYKSVVKPRFPTLERLENHG